jgi:hypothetical protein
MDPADISRAFHIEAAHSFRAGEPRLSGRVSATASVHTESYWLGVLKFGPADLSFLAEQHSQIAQRQLAAVSNTLSWALSLSAGRFLKAHADLLRRVRSEGGDVTLLVTICGGEVGSFTLAPEVSLMLGELGIAVEFELADE